MTNTITAAAKTAAGIAARLAAAAIMSTLVLGSAVIPAKAATPTEAITVPGTAVHRGAELGERLRRTTVVNQLTCRTLSGFTAGAVPPPRSCDQLSASPATRLAGAAPAGARFQD
jgi:hypothetical protein